MKIEKNSIKNTKSKFEGKIDTFIKKSKILIVDGFKYNIKDLSLEEIYKLINNSYYFLLK